MMCLELPNKQNSPNISWTMDDKLKNLKRIWKRFALLLLTLLCTTLSFCLFTSTLIKIELKYRRSVLIFINLCRFP